MHIQVRKMNQKGFTLVEVLVAMVVSGMLIAGIVIGIFQVSWGSIRSNDQVVALTDVHYAALFIKKDLQMAQITTLTDGNPDPQGSVTLDWTDYTTFESLEPQDHSSSYELLGTELLRTYDGTARVVGRHITYIGFTQNDRVIDVVITVTAPGTSQRSETLKFSVEMRTEVTE